MYNDTVLGPPWPEQPSTHELLIHVADMGPSTPHLSTTATIIVHLVPWKASTVATSTHQSTVRGFSGPWGLGERILKDEDTCFFFFLRWNYERRHFRDNCWMQKINLGHEVPHSVGNMKTELPMAVVSL